jgi:hypothetical protein
VAVVSGNGCRASTFVCAGAPGRVRSERKCVATTGRGTCATGGFALFVPIGSRLRLRKVRGSTIVRCRDEKPGWLPGCIRRTERSVVSSHPPCRTHDATRAIANGTPAGPGVRCGRERSRYLSICTRVCGHCCEVSVSLVCRVSLGGAALDFLSTLLKYRLKYIRQPTAPALTA